MKITEAMRKRVRRAGYRFTGHGHGGKCLVCGRSFPDCPHSAEQNHQVATIVQQSEEVCDG